MSATREGSGEGLAFKGIGEIPIEQIDPNPDNPRLEFPESELDRLRQSIDVEGVLVPIVLAPEDNGRYTLIDGERRFRCARDLGLEIIPAILAGKKNRTESLIQMFNIHQVREPWQDMPLAYAIKRLREEVDVSDPKQLSDLTGLSMERTKRLLHALELPVEYQQYIRKGEIPLNFFWELKRSVIEPLAKNRKGIYDRYGEQGLTQAFVNKRLKGSVTDTISLRNVGTIINWSAKDAADSGKSVLDDTLKNLIEDQSLTVAQAYEDTIQIMVEADKLERTSSNMLTSFRRLLGQSRNEDERTRIRGILERMVHAVQEMLANG